jgi:hypothetical protein
MDSLEPSAFATRLYKVRENALDWDTHDSEAKLTFHTQVFKTWTAPQAKGYFQGAAHLQPVAPRCVHELEEFSTPNAGFQW